LLGGVAVLQDITQLKELERMKADFVAMVTHELRAPVAAIEQQLTVILKGLAGEINERQARMLGRAKERAKGLLDLVKDLLDLSKIEAGMQVQYMEPVNIGELLTKVVDLMRSQAEQKGLHLEFELESALPSVNADAANMEGVFTNLISNAIKYTPEGGRVRVVGKREGDYIRIDVQDTGIGISEKDLPRIFERFYRVKTEKTRQIVGTGLGLSIVKQVVDAHLGTIDVQSVENQGTLFTVKLPVVAK
jgi:signal transduction histidine kinase